MCHILLTKINFNQSIILSRALTVIKVSLTGVQLQNYQASNISETSRNLNIRTQTGDEKWWSQQSHCWTPFTHELQNWLGLCRMRYLQYGQLQTTPSRNLYTNLEQTPLNRCQQLPAAYKWVVNRIDKQLTVLASKFD